MKRKTMKRNFSNGGTLETEMKQLIEEKQRFWLSGNNTYKVNICEFTSDLKYYPTNSHTNGGRDIIIKYKNIVRFFNNLNSLKLMYPNTSNPHDESGSKCCPFVFDIPRNNVKHINKAFNYLDKAIKADGDVTKMNEVKVYISSHREPVLGSFCRSYKDK